MQHSGITLEEINAPGRPGWELLHTSDEWYTLMMALSLHQMFMELTRNLEAPVWAGHFLGV